MMDDLNDFDQDVASRFLDIYINTLVEQVVAEKFRHWYVKRVEQHIQQYPDVRIHTLPAQHVTASKVWLESTTNRNESFEWLPLSIEYLDMFSSALSPISCANSMWKHF